MTFTADEARDRPRAEPVYLASIQTLNSGPLLRFSDRNVEVAGVRYTDYLASVTGVGDTLLRASSGFANVPISLVFKNERYDGFAHLSDLAETYPLAGAAVTLASCYLDDDSTPAAAETLFLGNLDSPRQITVISFVCAAICREAFASIANR